MALIALSCASACTCQVPLAVTTLPCWESAWASFSWGDCRVGINAQLKPLRDDANVSWDLSNIDSMDHIGAQRLEAGMEDIGGNFAPRPA